MEIVGLSTPPLQLGSSHGPRGTWSLYIPIPASAWGRYGKSVHTACVGFPRAAGFKVASNSSYFTVNFCTGSQRQSSRGSWLPLVLQCKLLARIGVYTCGGSSSGTLVVSWTETQTLREPACFLVIRSQAVMQGCKTSIGYVNPGDLAPDSQHCSDADSRVCFQHCLYTMSSYHSSFGMLNELRFAWQVKKEECAPFSSITNLTYLTCHIQILSIILYYICLGAIEQNGIKQNQRTAADHIEMCSSSIFCFHLGYMNN